MKLIKIAILIVLMSLFVSCDKKNGGFYPYPDETGKVDDDTATTDKDKIEPDIDKIVVDEDLDVDIDIDVDEEVDDDSFIPPVDDETDDDSGISDDDTPDDDTDKILYGCGNGVTDLGEECDNGSFNTNAPGEIGITCRTDCKYARCGDGIKDTGEFCDDGNNLNGDYCSSDCMTATGRCGDGVVQTNEICDKAPYGNGIGSYCNDDCTEVSGSCGDGIVQDNEICDKAEFGAGTGPFYCAADCKKIIGSCGDGTVQPNETCDDGSNNGKYGFCNPTCTGPGKRCGDGVKDWEGDEACDDGNTEDGDYCSADCLTLYGFCGDGAVQPNEACDKAVFGAGTGLYCSDDCKTVLGRCGDEIVQSHEQCDWGSKNIFQFCQYGEEPPCQRCNTVCNLVEGIPTYCGDGRIDLQNGEFCDKAEPDVGEGKGIGAYCSFDCTEVLGSCGDGVKQPHEACDKATTGDGIGPEYCSDDCTAIIGFCGDGTPQSNEMCDLGAGNTDYCQYEQTSCMVCNSQCKVVEGITSLCGDGRTDAFNGELCDSGANNGNYRINAPGYCNSDCLGLGAGGYCGDNLTQGAEGEECDNGSNNGQVDCEYGLTSCQVCSTSCRMIEGNVKFCGDGELSNGENCDDGELNGDYGKCKTDCTGIGNHCGDGQTTDSEVCDDGVNNGNYGYCAFDCKSEGKRCGDGIKQPEEVCDAGDDNGVYRLTFPGNCDGDCQGTGEAGYCGNSVTEVPFEGCDKGGDNGKLNCDYGQTTCTVCTSDCQSQNGTTSFCGDSKIDAENNEKCDNGANNGNYGFCKADCSGPGPKCGDGNIDGGFGEICDDGELNGTHGKCNTACSGIGPHCGDGIQNGSEICDNGINNGNYGFCNLECTGMGPYCGDGNKTDGEFCDDGANNGTYGYCNAECTAMGPYCGDGFKTDDEECDDGVLNGQYGKCRTDCSGINTTCGNGVLNPENGEVCDSGENNGEYGYCKLDCSGPGERCGDGIEQPEHGENCDDGVNNGNYGYCKIDCKGLGERCGDGIINGIENCDDGANNGTYGYCKIDCKGLGERCGDGAINGPETCDDGILNGTNGKCSSTCNGPHEWCGDGIKNGSETCDDGADNGKYNFCKSDCSGSTYCGDGIKNGPEICDDGANNGSSGYCNSSCTAYIPICGNGLVESGEVCDDGENNGQYSSGESPYCNSDCKGYGEGGVCGDGTINGPEACDDGILNGEPGQCNIDCTMDSYCGDGIIDEGEFCDTADVNCADFSQFSSGIVACPGDCSVPDLSACVDDPSYSSPFFTTSQTNCYNNTGIIVCPNEGNPFYGQEPDFGYAIQNFTVDADTISESESGLVWQRSTPSVYSGCTGGDPAGSKCTVGDGLAYCDGLVLGGYDDWRLPAAYELSNIMNFAKTDPLVFSDFSSTQSDSYWSLGNIYHLISFFDGKTIASSKSSTGLVKCVRGENKMLSKEVLQSGDLFVDVLDGSWNDVVFWQYDSAQIDVDWEDALAYCSNVTENGLSGFRLPTVVELQSFVFASLYAIPPYVGTGSFWTSTTVHATPANAYAVDFSTGNVSMTGKTGTNFVICVK